jgi:sterol desaturase/sphingolipid hydroxylase (fatty acid hydroxylase superfamily)
MIPPRLAPIVFGFLVSGIMSLIVSGIATLRAFGWETGFGHACMNAWVISWAIAFPTIVVVAPFVRKFVASITKKPA